MDYQGLVIAIARKIHERIRAADIELDLDDLIQEGSLGLLRAAQKFDPSRNVQFSTFAYPRIQGAINDYLRRLDPLSQQDRGKVKRLGEVRGKLVQSLEREPTAEELAGATDLETGEIDFLQQLRGLAESELNPNARTDSALLDLEASGSQESDLGREALAADVDSCLAEALEPVERRTFLLRFWRQLTLKHVGTLLKRPTQTIHNIEKRARDKLRQCLEGKGWSLSDEIEFAD